MDNFSNVEKIGEGTYGVVYKGKDILTGKQIALKKIKLDFEPDGVPSTALREISVLRSLHHSAVVELFDVMVSDKKIYLIFEYLPMDLKCFMELTKKPLCPDLAKSYLRQLLEGLAYCHGRRVIHRDIKPQNLLVDAKGNIKLADFGLCRTFGIPMRAYTHEVITLWYRAPEILLGSNFYSTAVDVWSVACVYAEMVNGRSLFPGDSEIDQLFRVFRALGTPGAAVWHEASELPDFRAEFPYWEPRPAHDLLPDKVRASPLACALFDEMLRYEPCARLAAHRAARHPYLVDAHRLPPKELREYACTSSSSSSSSDSQYSS